MSRILSTSIQRPGIAAASARFGIGRLPLHGCGPKGTSLRRGTPSSLASNALAAATTWADKAPRWILLCPHDSVSDDELPKATRTRPSLRRSWCGPRGAPMTTRCISPQLEKPNPYSVHLSTFSCPSGRFCIADSVCSITGAVRFVPLAGATLLLTL